MAPCQHDEVVLERGLEHGDARVRDRLSRQFLEERGDVMLVDLDLHGLALDRDIQAPRLGRVDQMVEALLDDELHSRGGGRGRELLGSSHRGDLTAVKEEHPVADLGHFVHVVRGIEDRDPGFVPLCADEVADLVGDAENAEDLIRVIRNTVDSPRSWAPRRMTPVAMPGPIPQGGGLGGLGAGGLMVPTDDPFENPEGGTIEYFAGGKSLVVSQTREIQDEIEKLLEELRISKKQQEIKSEPAS